MSAPTLLDGQQICPNCGGSGKTAADCEECDNAGWVPDPEDGGTMMCPECHSEPCENCNGDGGVVIPKEEGGAA